MSSESVLAQGNSIHLLVLVHGMWGEPLHLSEMRRIISETHVSPATDGTQLKVLVAETNREGSTYDGIDWGGERIATEILEEVEKYKEEGNTVTRFSITGYSLGGLLSRYVIGILHQQHFFDRISPVNFNTTATPHLGLPRYPSFFSGLASTLGPKLLSRTGEQFYSVDSWSPSGRPLLEVMADPQRVFYQALALFPNITFYANAIHDVTVPYVTAAIELNDPFVDADITGLEVELDEKYSPLIKSYQLPEHPPTPVRKPTVLTPTWFKSLKSDRPLLPPFLQFRFPLNVVFWISIPMLIPILFSIAITRLSLEQRSSRARIRRLEQDSSSSEKLIHVLARLEKDIEDVVVDIMDSEASGGSPSEPSTSTTSKSKSKEERKSQPILTPLQLKMAAALNQLPNLRKELAYIAGVRNTHASIVSRDIKRFPMHKVGEGVIRHWADHFVL